MNEFVKKQADELKSRQRKRLLERGFKGIPDPEDPADEKEPDVEILEDPDDFDKAAQDIKDLRGIIDVNKGLIMDGNWRPKGEDAEYQLPELLKNSRRMPEIVIILKCKEEVAIKRTMNDCEDDLKAEYERKMEEREEAKVKKRADDRAEKEQELKDAPPEEEDMTPE